MFVVLLLTTNKLHLWIGFQTYLEELMIVVLLLINYTYELALKHIFCFIWNRNGSPCLKKNITLKIPSDLGNYKEAKSKDIRLSYILQVSNFQTDASYNHCYLLVGTTNNTNNIVITGINKKYLIVFHKIAEDGSLFDIFPWPCFKIGSISYIDVNVQNYFQTTC